MNAHGLEGEMMPDQPKADLIKGSLKTKKPKSKQVKALLNPLTSTELDQSALHLLHRVLSTALEIYSSKMPSGSVISQRQYAVLTVLNDAQGRGAGGLSQSEMVRLTGIDRSTMADLLTRMISQGLLLRQKSTEDFTGQFGALSP